MSKEYYGAPLIITYSGGKDSDVLLHLAKSCLRSDEFEVLNSHTSVDAPETVYHIREVFKSLNDAGIKATVHFPKDKDGKHITMWNLILKMQMPPTRRARYCCQHLKETTTPNRIAALGVRSAESANRRGRDIFGIRKNHANFSLAHTEEVFKESKQINDENWDCTLIKTMKEHGDTVVNAIYDWTDADVWDYIIQEKIAVNVLYSRGYSRVGCVGCPLASYKHVQKEFADYPKYKQMYINIFDKMLQERRKAGKNDGERDEWHKWQTGEDVFKWWLEMYKRECYGQMSFFDDEQ